MTNVTALSIREYGENDLPVVRECLVELQEFERRIDGRLRPGEEMASAYLARLLQRCRDYGGTIFVAEWEGRVAGCVTILARVPFEELDDPPGTFALVTDLVVVERFRRRGIGAALLRQAEAYATAAGATELRIGVLSENRDAKDRYRRAGFAPYLETMAKRLDRPRG